MENERFIVRKEHLDLLSEAHISWNEIETGAPTIDPKRPYGNSDVVMDIYEILDPEGSKEGRDLTEENESILFDLHKETEKTLQIVLETGRFLPGIYEKDRNWEFKGFTDSYNEDLRKTIASSYSFIVLAGHLRRSYGMFSEILQKYYSSETLISNALYYFTGKLSEVMVPQDLGFRDKIQELQGKDFNEFS